LLLFALWRDVLGAEGAAELAEALSDWPLTPAVCRGRRVVVSAALAPHLFSAPPTAAEDGRRAQLQREAGRLGALATAAAADAAAAGGRALGDGTGGGETGREWAWAGQRAAGVHPQSTLSLLAAAQVQNLSPYSLSLLNLFPLSFSTL